MGGAAGAFAVWMLIEAYGFERPPLWAVFVAAIGGGIASAILERLVFPR